MSSLTATHAPKGLEGVVATTSKICYIDGDLGGLAQADGQHAGGKRIETADMTGLVDTEGAPHPLQSRVRRQPGGFVEQQDSAK